MLTGVVTSLVRWGRYFLHFPVGKTNPHRARLLASPVRTNGMAVHLLATKFRKENV